MENQQRELYMRSKVTKKNKSRRTVAGIVDYDKKTVSIGVSQCTNNDTFLKEKGRMISLGRAGKKPVATKSFDDETNPVVLFKEMAVEAIGNNNLEQWKKAEKI